MTYYYLFSPIDPLTLLMYVLPLFIQLLHSILCWRKGFYCGDTVCLIICWLFDGFQLFSSLLSHNQFDAFFVVLLRLLTAVFLSLPFIPKAVKLFQRDCAGKPLAPISTGNNHVFHPFSRHCYTNEVYFDRFP